MLAKKKEMSMTSRTLCVRGLSLWWLSDCCRLLAETRASHETHTMK